MAASIAVLILAGGQATRFPGKLQHLVDGTPMLVRVFRNLRECGPVFISINEPLPPHVETMLPCTKIPDRWFGAGPIGGLVSAMDVSRGSSMLMVSSPCTLSALCPAAVIGRK